MAGRTPDDRAIARSLANHMSRRTLLGSAAALGLTAATAGLVKAGDPPPSRPTGPVSGDWTEPHERPHVSIDAAPTVAGRHYVSLAGLDLKTALTSDTYTSSTGELASTGSGAFTAPLHLPPGARIEELVAYLTRPDADSIQVRLVCHRSSLASFASFVELADVTSLSLPQSPGIQTLVGSVAAGTDGAIVDSASAAYFVIANMPADASHQLWGVRVGFTRADAGLFTAITPTRVYDSRRPQPNQGRLSRNHSRNVSVADGRNLNTGAVTVADIVPIGARAIAYNLTATSSTGHNFLAVTPGGATSFAASAINWSSSGQSIANASVVPVDSARRVKVFCGSGTGSTHFIIDVVGFYA